MNLKEKKHIVLIGGGHTHALVLYALKKEPVENAHVTVINPETTAPYSGMLPGFVAGHYGRNELDIDLQILSRNVRADLIVDKAVSIDADKRIIFLSDAAELAYDLASIDIGITSHMHTLPGFTEYAIPAKPLGEFSLKWDMYRASTGAKHVIVIGGGIAGVELAMAMAFALNASTEEVSVKLLDRSRILAQSNAKTNSFLRERLKLNNVQIMEYVDIVEVLSTGVKLSDGSNIDANFVVGTAGATPHAWLEDTGLTLHDGFIEISETLQSSDPHIFAVGDCAHMTFNPRPKAGVYAVRQAPVLLRNLRNVLSHSELETYHPQSDFLKLVSLGSKRAFGEKNGISMAGRIMWNLKNHIDRKFMQQFRMN